MRSFASIGMVVAGLVLLGLSACGKPEPPRAVAPPFQGVQVVVGAVGDPAILATVNAQRGEWEASRGASCQIQKEAVDPASTGSAHVVVFRADLLGDFVDAQTLLVLPESLVRPPVRPEGDADPAEKKKEEPAEVDAFQFSDVIPAFREQVPKYGKDRMAFPYGGSALVLAYRPEAFERKENREAAKQAGIALEPPTTWDQLDKLAKFFQGRDWSGDGSSDFGIALALGADPEGVGDATYLARAASLAQHRDQYSLVFSSDTMEPRITTPPFVEALENLVALKASGPPGMDAFDIEAARKAFRKGNVAMLIDRAERPASWSEGGALVSVAVLPGSNRVYDPASKRWDEPPTPNRPSYLPSGGGWLVGVAASAQGKERAAAIDLARYLASPETASRVRSDRAFPMLPVRSSQAGQGLPDPTAAPGVDSRLWADAVSKTFNAVRVVPGLRIPQAEGYLADLEKGRVAAVKGEPADRALQTVAKAWNARTKALGVARQVWHYQKSLNSIITAPSPPPRRSDSDPIRGTRGMGMDETEDASPFVSNAEVEINRVLGLFDVPAFARRGKELEYALSRLSLRLGRDREGMLDMVKVRLREWSGVATSPDDWSDTFAQPIAPLWSLARLDPPSWSSRPASPRRRRAVAGDLVASVERFNRRWAAFLAGVDLNPINRRIDQYNRYYVFEKECVMGSARLAARHFVAQTPLSHETILADFPLLPTPALAR